MAYAEVSVESALTAIGQVPLVLREAVAAVSRDAIRQRPAPGRWSVTEYVCHLRDVYVAYTVRVHRARVEDRPILEPMLNDLRARRFRYNERDLPAVVEELGPTVSGCAEEIGRVRSHDWSRLVVRLPGEERSLLWLVRQAMHEGLHHLGDIRRLGEELK